MNVSCDNVIQVRTANATSKRRTVCNDYLCECLATDSAGARIGELNFSAENFSKKLEKSNLIFKNVFLLCNAGLAFQVLL